MALCSQFSGKLSGMLFRSSWQDAGTVSWKALGHVLAFPSETSSWETGSHVGSHHVCTTGNRTHLGEVEGCAGSSEPLEWERAPGAPLQRQSGKQLLAVKTNPPQPRLHWPLPSPFLFSPRLFSVVERNLGPLLGKPSTTAGLQPQSQISLF